MKDYTYKYKYFSEESVKTEEIIIRSEKELEKVEVIKLIQNHMLKTLDKVYSVISLIKE
jgi:hypothetical protein